MDERHRQTATPALENSESNLAEPHFDEIAVAIAQPVEPLAATTASHPRTRGIFGRRISNPALLILVFGAFGFATAAFGLAKLRERFTAGETPVAIAPAAQPSPAETSGTSSSATEKNLPPRTTTTTKTRPRGRGTESKPVARKVGEISY